MLPDGRLLALLADGMGGYRGGAYASRRTTEVVSQRLAAGDAVEAAVRAANDVIVADAQVAERAGMGTTLVGVLVDRGSYRVFNVGDSRAYHITVDGAEQVTEDHSFVAEAAKNGQLDGADAARSRWKNALTRSVGNEGTLDVDVFGPYSTDEPHVLVLCSDGVYKGTPDHVISSIVRAVPDVTTAAQTLIDVAFRRGSDDNMSAVLLEFGNLPRSAEITLPVPLMDGGPQVTPTMESPSVSVAQPLAAIPLAPTRDAPIRRRTRQQSSRLAIALGISTVGVAALLASYLMLREPSVATPDKSPNGQANADTTKDGTAADTVKEEKLTDTLVPGGQPQVAGDTVQQRERSEPSVKTPSPNKQGSSSPPRNQ